MTSRRSLAAALALTILAAGIAGSPAAATPAPTQKPVPITYSTDADAYLTLAGGKQELANVQKIIQAGIKAYKAGNKNAISPTLVTNRRVPYLKISVPGQPKSYSAWDVTGSYSLANGTYSLQVLIYTEKVFVPKHEECNPVFIPFGMVTVCENDPDHWDYYSRAYTVTHKKTTPVAGGAYVESVY